MIKMTHEEQKKVLIDMLDYLTKKCIENNIDFTLIGGSLIGAIRHQGIIPWDDDVDIILFPEEYKKLQKVLGKGDDRYRLLSYPSSKGYYYPFMKLVDVRTVVYEINSETIPDYGVFIDIFQYRYISNNSMLRFLSFKYQEFVKMMLGFSVLNTKRIADEENYLKKICFLLLKSISSDRWIRRMVRLCQSSKTDYVVNIWGIYGFKREVQLASNFKKFKLIDFEGKKTMVVESYDDILRTTFGDYMKLPPIEQRNTPHLMDIYWKKDEK